MRGAAPGRTARGAADCPAGPRPGPRPAPAAAWPGWQRHRQVAPAPAARPQAAAGWRPGPGPSCCSGVGRARLRAARLQGRPGASARRWTGRCGSQRLPAKGRDRSPLDIPDPCCGAPSAPIRPHPPRRCGAGGRRGCPGRDRAAGAAASRLPLRDPVGRHGAARPPIHRTAANPPAAGRRGIAGPAPFAPAGSPAPQAGRGGEVQRPAGLGAQPGCSRLRGWRRRFAQRSSPAGERRPAAAGAGSGLVRPGHRAAVAVPRRRRFQTHPPGSPACWLCRSDRGQRAALQPDGGCPPARIGRWG